MDRKDSHEIVIPKRMITGDFLDMQDLLQESGFKKSCEKLFVIVPELSRVKICDRFALNGEISFVLKEGASLTFLHDNFALGLIKSETSWSFYLQESSVLNCFLFLAGEENAKKSMKIFVEGRKARANSGIFYMASGAQKLDLSTLQEHRAQDTESNVCVNCVLSGDANVKYCGKIFVQKDAHSVAATQKNKNVVLGKNVTVDSHPQMEILNDNVSCKHGCATGVLDEGQLFYLRSRGLSKKKARDVMMTSFFDFLINSLDNQAIKEDLEKRIKTRMRQIL